MVHISARAALRLAVVALAVSSATLAARQADRSRTEALSKRAADRLQALQHEADRLASEERTLLGDLRKLEVDRQLRNEEFSQLSARAESTVRELARTSAQVETLEREDLAERPELGARLVALYTLGQGRYLRMLLSVSDVRRVGQASRMVASLAERDRARIVSHQKRLDALKAGRAALQSQARDLAAQRATAEKAHLAADRAVAARNALIANIDSARDLNAQLSGELLAAQQKLQATLRGMTTGAGGEPTLPLRPFRGDLDWPVAGSLRQGFGRAAAGRPPSNGVEIAALEGAPVKAIHDGTVAFADDFAGFGKLVIVDHGSQTFSLYGNLLEMAVASGAKVAQGDVLGAVGPSVASAAASSAGGGTAGLYFELRIDGRPVDPLQWLKRK